MLLCMICKERPASIHLNTGPYKEHLWVCDECNPIQVHLLPRIKKLEFQKWIQNIRVNHGVSMRILSEKTGIDVVKISHYENGQEKLTEEDKKKILSVFLEIPLTNYGE